MKDKLQNLSKINLLLLLTLILGFILRVYFIFVKSIFADEVYYAVTSKGSSFFAIITGGDWLKDHAAFYLIFLKILQFLTTDINLLRISNLFLYAFICVMIYKFFSKFYKGLFILFPVILFSFHPYFVFLNSSISPYNFVFLFSVLAFIFLSSYILFYPKSKLGGYLFVLFSALAFYSDFSAVYFYLLLLPIILMLHKWNEKLSKDLLIFYIFSFVLILPEIYILNKNFSYFYGLNPTLSTDINFITFFTNFTKTIFYFYNQSVSIIIFFTFMLLNLIISLKANDKFLKYLSSVVFWGFITNFIFLYFFNNHYFYIFQDRTFWIFYLLLILGLTSIFKYLIKFRKSAYVIFFVILFLILSKYLALENGYAFGRNISYNKFIKDLISSSSFKKINNIVFITKDKEYIPLRLYYFEGLNSLGMTSGLKIKKYFIDKNIFALSSTKNLVNITTLNNSYNAFIMFEGDYKSYLNIISYLKYAKLNGEIFRLRCTLLSCDFYKAFQT